MKLRLAMIALGTTMLVGCSLPKTSPPIDVALIPNDCRNRELIVNWLNEQAMQPMQPFESEQDYERHRKQIRAKIWNLRYHCQPV